MRQDDHLFDARSAPSEIQPFQPDETGSYLARLPPPPPLPPSLAALLSTAYGDHDTLQRPALDASMPSACAYIPPYDHLGSSGFHPSHEATGIDRQGFASTVGEGWTLSSIISYEEPTAAYRFEPAWSTAPSSLVQNAAHWPSNRMAQGPNEPPVTGNSSWILSSSSSSSSGLSSGDGRVLAVSGQECELKYSDRDDHHNPQDIDNCHAWYDTDKYISSDDFCESEAQRISEQYTQQDDDSHVCSINTQEDDDRPSTSQGHWYSSTPAASQPSHDLYRQASTFVQLGQQIALPEAWIDSARTHDLDVEVQDMVISDAISHSAEPQPCVQYGDVTEPTGDTHHAKPDSSAIVSALSGHWVQDMKNSAQGDSSIRPFGTRPSQSLRRPRVDVQQPALRRSERRLVIARAAANQSRRSQQLILKKTAMALRNMHVKPRRRRTA
ncbi:hypothetical protein L227DRAFT_617511 [Lentinus tigrinus ALCF2SS1-6]|uniref:Uncharacterized protein n=1 Tax=Lentinus tigrinus ALCF2SS1-6 TaxID=1328759 RepID=A0A5C2RRM6_9APHY|nr:hypothetical protein L227DRAFT_617511 [Lentinus tigrinus ALCF2SS1-6]